MKKSLITLIIIPILLSGCATDKYLQRPKDTNLLFWITQRCSGEDFKQAGCSFIPGWFGAEEYLDYRYELLEVGDKYSETHHYTIPPKHVTYVISGYPDALDGYAVTSIEITDPEITVYGLTMNSTNQEIENKMKQLQFVKKNDAYFKNNCTFNFSSDFISIKAPSTNKHHIIY